MTEQAHPAADFEVAFTTRDVHVRDRLSYWCEVAKKAYVDHEFSTSVGRAFEGIIRTSKLDVIEFASFACSECTADRTARNLKSYDDDDLLITLQLRGRAVLRQDGRDAVVQPDDVFLVDPRRPFSISVGAGNDVVIAKVARSELQARLGDILPLAARPLARNRTETVLARQFLLMLAERSQFLADAAASKVAAQALDLIGIAFEAQMADVRALQSSTRATTLLRLKASIESRLHDPDLKPRLAAASIGISVRYANQLLAEEGTSLERFIVTRRLSLSQRVLGDPNHAHRPVSDIAFSCGFSDVSHFTRRFKTAFGCSPTEWRAKSRARAR